MKRFPTILAAVAVLAGCLYTLAKGPFINRAEPLSRASQQAAAAARPDRARSIAGGASSQRVPQRKQPPRYGAAIGGQPGKAPLGARTADIRDFGATTTADAAPAIQRAYDSLISGGAVNGALNTTRGVLFIPSGVWPMCTPLIADGAFIDVIGERGTVLSCKSASVLSYPIVSGQKRAVNWAATDPHFGDSQIFPTDHRMDVYGKLDSTWAGAANLKFGLASRSPSTVAAPNVASHWVQVWAAAPATGACDSWKDTRVFTLELAIENPLGAMGAVNICGMGAVGGTVGTSTAIGGPWTLSSDASQFIFQFNTIEGINGNPRSFRFGDTTLSGVQRIWVEIDFSQNDASGLCLIRAGQNGKQVAITRGQGCRQAAQTFDIGTHATGGTFAFTGVRADTNVQTTVNISSGAAQAAIQAAMDSVYGPGNTTVGQYGTGGAGGSGAAFRLTMGGSLLNFSTQMPSFDGTNLTGVSQPIQAAAEAGFLAGQMIHLAPNYLAPFWFFGDAMGGSDQFLAHPISVLNLYAFELSNCLRYSDAGAGNTEVRVDGLPRTDLNRYGLFDASTVVIYNPNDKPDMLAPANPPPNKTWNGLVRFTLGTAGGASGLDTFGWFNIALNGFPPPDTFEPVQDQTYKQLRLESWGPMGGGGMYCHNTFNCRVDDCDFAGGWQGLTIFGGYDYSLRNLIGYGADAFLMAQTAIGRQEGIQRIAVGNTVYRFSGCFWEAQGLMIEASNLNAGMPGVVNDGFAQGSTPTTITLSASASAVENAYQNGTVKIISGTGLANPPQVRTIANNGYVGATRVATITSPWSVNPDSTSAYQVSFPNANTESLIRIHPEGTYGCRYYFGGLGTDNELPGQVCPLVHASRCAGTVGGSVMRFNNFTTSGQGRTPAFIFDLGQTIGVYANYNPVNVLIHNLQTDGTEVAVDGPGWNIHIDNTELPLDQECVRYTGPSGPAFPVHVDRLAWLSSWPPAAGRFVAGTLRLLLWDPSAAAVAEYRCTANGTAAWSATHVYQLQAYTSFGGFEWTPIIASVGRAPWLPSVSVPGAPAITATGGGASGGLLQSGTLYAQITWQTASGESGVSPESTLNVAAGNIPQLTVPALPGGVTGANLYVTSNNGAIQGGPGKELLYASNLPAGTYNLAAAINTVTYTQTPNAVWQKLQAVSTPTFKAVATLAP